MVSWSQIQISLSFLHAQIGAYFYAILMNKDPGLTLSQTQIVETHLKFLNFCFCSLFGFSNGTAPVTL